MTTAIEEVVRRERGRIVGGLLRLCGGLDAAEDAFQDAALAALDAWRTAIPDNPGAWLMTTAKNRARDRRRHEAVIAAHAPPDEPAAIIDGDDRDIDTIADDYLRLILTCCHPAIALDNQIALALKTICGFTTDEIARTYVTTEATISQRILRAKKQIADADLRYAAPARDELADRIAAPLGVVYAMYNEGHTARSGPLMRLDLQAEALRLARLLADLVPTEPEAVALVALIAFGAARAATRVEPDGTPILLEHQDRTRWDRGLVREAFIAIERARSLGPPGAYTLQAEIAALHVAAPTYADTPWPAIAALYARLRSVAPSPIVELNRAIAIGMADGPAAGLEALAPLARALADYHLFYAARADLLARLGKDPRPDLRKALALVTNDGERRLLERRLRD